MSNFDGYQVITDRMIAALERGTVPWHTPWTGGQPPRSMSTRKPYRGVNRLLLTLTALERGYTSPWWATFDQVKRLGGHVRKGQGRANGTGATMVTLWKTYQKWEEDPDEPGGRKRVTHWLMKAFWVWNYEQCEGLPERYGAEHADEWAQVTDAEDILAGYFGRDGAPALLHDSPGRAYYRTDGSDEIHIPPREQFRSAGDYYSTAFHEAAHSTGWKTRLDRPGITGFDHFGSGQYAKEELAAQMTAAFLDARAGIEGEFDQSAAYIASWLKALADDRRLVVQAASQAEKAAGHILGELDQDAVADEAAAEPLEAARA